MNQHNTINTIEFIRLGPGPLVRWTQGIANLKTNGRIRIELFEVFKMVVLVTSGALMIKSKIRPLNKLRS